MVNDTVPVFRQNATSRYAVWMSWDDNGPPRRETAKEYRVLRVSRAESRDTDRANLRSLLRLRFLEWRYARTLRRGLDAGLTSLPCQASIAADALAARALIASSWLARRLWSSRDRCLPRSLALTHALRTQGCAAQLVIGVAMQPFAAHAWVQDDDRVVNDTLDHAALFTPILVV